MTLKDFWLKSGLTQELLAQMLGLSRSYTVQLLNGTRKASVQTAKQIQVKTKGKVKAMTVLGL